MKAVLFLTVISVLTLAAGTEHAGAGNDDLSEWESFAKSADAKLMINWMNGCMRDIMTDEHHNRKLQIRVPEYSGRFGIFVTLVRRGHTRGCFGAFHHPSDDISEVLREYLRGALRSDPRYAPLETYECDDTKIVITVASQAIPVDDPRTLDLSRYGVKVTCDSDEIIVFVPFEVKTYDYLRRSLKGRTVLEYAAFRAVTIR